MKYLFMLFLFVSLVFSQVNNSTPALGSRGKLVQDVTRGLVTVPFNEMAVHEGRHYSYSVYQDELDDGDTLGIFIVVPDITNWPYLVFEGGGENSIEVLLFEDATHTVGSKLDVYNSNRNSSNVNTTEIYAFTTRDGSDGTMIYNYGSTETQIDIRGTNEWILKQNTVYLACIISKESKNIVYLKITWYEHEL